MSEGGRPTDLLQRESLIARREQRFENLRRVMRRRNQVEIVRAALLEFEKGRGQLAGVRFIPEAAVRDLVVLADAALK